MEPIDDKELNQLLKAWEAPAAPPALDARVLSKRRPRRWQQWWRWLLTGSIRIPVPVGVAAVAALAMWLYYSRPVEVSPPARDATVTLADFQPVRQLVPVVKAGEVQRQ